MDQSKETDTLNAFMKDLHERNKGMVIEFTADSTFRSLRERADKSMDTITVDKYELSPDKKFVLIKDGKGKGLFIVELADKHLKISFDSASQLFISHRRITE